MKRNLRYPIVVAVLSQDDLGSEVEMITIVPTRKAWIAMRRRLDAVKPTEHFTVQVFSPSTPHQVIEYLKREITALDLLRRSALV